VGREGDGKLSAYWDFLVDLLPPTLSMILGLWTVVGFVRVFQKVVEGPSARGAVVVAGRVEVLEGTSAGAAEPIPVMAVSTFL